MSSKSSISCRIWNKIDAECPLFGQAGCSTIPEPPPAQRIVIITATNPKRTSPKITCRISRRPILESPQGCSAVRSTRGPPCSPWLTRLALQPLNLGAYWTIRSLGNGLPPRVASRCSGYGSSPDLFHLIHKRVRTSNPSVAYVLIKDKNWRSQSPTKNLTHMRRTCVC